MPDDVGYTVPLEQVYQTLAFVNELRRRNTSMKAASIPYSEDIVSRLFRSNEHLAMYGSLIPGKENHHLVSSIEGVWTTGRIQGDFLDRGWGAGLGYPAVRWRPGGPDIPVHVLTSSALHEHWERLDDFEGSDYQRILVPVFVDGGAVIVSNLYALRAEES